MLTAYVIGAMIPHGATTQKTVIFTLTVRKT
jgi:hypothetical protein